jgi:L-ascorbate metabolism protein UlaG (beta-lactamase superfamily)
MINDIVKKIVRPGHATFRIDSGMTVYFDPYQISSEPKADLILITHDHFDHCSPEDVAKIQKPETVVVTEKDSAKKLNGDIRVMKAGESLNVSGIKIEAVPAYNIGKDFHPKENGWLGFIIEIDGVRIYHTGDSDFIPEMKDFNVDIALLPVSGTYVMTADEAVEAAMAINPNLAIPMHYGSVVGDEKDATRFKDALEGKIGVLIL